MRLPDPEYSASSTSIDEAASLRERERALDGGRKLAVGDEDLRAAVLEHEGDRLGVQPRVERVQHRAGHRHAEMAFVHLRRVGEHDGDRVADADAALRERRGEPPAARVSLGPGVSGARRGSRRRAADRRTPRAR